MTINITAFVQLDFKDFYPFITEEILEKSLGFAKQYVNIAKKDIQSIKHCRKSLLFLNDEPWKKKNTVNCFDVTMGSLGRAEMCELVELYILSLLQNRVDKKDKRLYHDDRLAVLRNANGRTTDLYRKDIISIFKTRDFNIDIQTNFKIVDFLDVSFNLENGTYLFKKPNDKLLYAHTSSNHPSKIIRQIPNSVGERLSKNSSNQEISEKSKAEYEEALSKSGYSTKLYTNNLSHNSASFSNNNASKNKAQYNLAQPAIHYECEKQYWKKLLTTY